MISEKLKVIVFRNASVCKNGRKNTAGRCISDAWKSNNCKNTGFELSF